MPTKSNRAQVRQSLRHDAFHLGLLGAVQTRCGARRLDALGVLAVGLGLLLLVHRGSRPFDRLAALRGAGMHSFALPLFLWTRSDVCADGSGSLFAFRSDLKLLPGESFGSETFSGPKFRIRNFCVRWPGGGRVTVSGPLFVRAH